MIILRLARLWHTTALIDVDPAIWQYQADLTEAGAYKAALCGRATDYRKLAV